MKDYKRAFNEIRSHIRIPSQPNTNLAKKLGNRPVEGGKDVKFWSLDYLNTLIGKSVFVLEKDAAATVRSYKIGIEENGLQIALVVRRLYYPGDFINMLVLIVK